MKLIRPLAITDANMVSNVPEGGTFPEYSATQTYGVGEVVISSSGTAPTHRKYESLVDSNTGNALDDPTKWLDLGPTNRWAMFDTKNGTATTGIDASDFVSLSIDFSSGGTAVFVYDDYSLIDATITVDGRADGVALLGLEATAARITVNAGAYGTVYDQTYSLQSDSGINNWYAYFNEPIVYQADLVVTDLPAYSNPDIRVRIYNSNADAVCGTFVVGQTRELGGTTYGAKGGIQDYSRKETDDFGNYTLVERAFAKRLNARVVCVNEQVDSIFSLLAELRATPVIWLGTETYAFTWLFGWVRDWATEITYPTHSHLTIEIEGLT